MESLPANLSHNDRRLIEAFVSQAASSFGSHLKGLVLFGSVARGTSRPDSDIDILIVHDLPRGEASHKLSSIRRGPFSRFSTVPLNEREFRDHPWVLLDIVDHGIPLMDAGIVTEEFTKLRGRMKELGTRKWTLPDGRWYWELKPGSKPREEITL